MTTRITVAVALAVGLAYGVSLAQVTTQSASPPAAQAASGRTPVEPNAPRECGPKADEDTLTGGWFGFAEKLREQGLSVNLGLTQVYQQNARGGQSTRRRAGRYSGRYDLEVEADLEKLIHLPGGRVYALARGGWSDGIDEPSVGSLFGVNSVPVGDRPIDLWQLYYEQSFLNDKAFLRVGKIDLTGCFECRGCPGSFDGSSFANDETSQFLNGSLVNNPTIPFPDPGLGVVAHVEPVEWWYVSAAVADADADVRETGFNTTFHGKANTFSIYETGFLPRLPSSKGDLQGAYRFGMWYDPQAKDRLDGSGVKRDGVGFYTSCDQMLWKENGQEDDAQGLGAFGRYGIADADVSEIKSFWSTGLQYRGLIPSRDKDVTSFGVGQGRLSRQAEFTTSPYGIPYRCLYSRTVENLYCAGRNISTTHAALSSTRVMSTCATLGQAVGTAAAIATREAVTPRGVYQRHRSELQRALMEDDCYLPGRVREASELTRAANLSASAGNPESLRNGIDRPVGADDNGWTCAPGGWVVYDWGRATPIADVRLVFDSDLHANGLGMPHAYPLNQRLASPPQTLVKGFRLETLDESGNWRTSFETEQNYQRLVRIALSVTATAIRFTPLSTWGAPLARVQAFEIT